MSSGTTCKENSSAGPQEKVIGIWKLVSAEDVDPNTGKWVPYTFGNPPSGYFIYDSTGHASIQIMTTPPVKLATPDSPTPAEALEIFNGYIAYYGTYISKDCVVFSFEDTFKSMPPEEANVRGTLKMIENQRLFRCCTLRPSVRCAL